MTINYARESVIDFTKPFMNLGISILFKVSVPGHCRQFATTTHTPRDCWLVVSLADKTPLTIHITEINLPSSSSAGPDDTPDASLLLHEPIGCGNMDLCPRRIRARVNHNVCGGQVFPVRVAESTSLRDREQHLREPIYTVQQLLVHCRHNDATGFRSQSQGKHCMWCNELKDIIN